MSRTIDERIVEMQFNNQQFEQNVKVSMGTLDKLKQALNFGKGKNGFDDLSASARRFDMSGISNAVTEVQSKFSALDIIGVTALVNIANQAINTGKHMLNSLTIAPISQGFQEYELKMGSVQTILAGTGEKLEVVNKYLEDLNTYSDKTIYSFRDMTSNIGKFTNAGVKLKDAVAAIKGVSNVAAVSGANAAEASRAMYNFSQALSSGAVRLVDWKSIENANMATVEFKETLLETATALGTVVKEGDGYRSTTTNLQGKISDVFTTTRGFNDALAHQWMTTDVLTQALELYATDVRDLTDKEKEEYETKLRGLHFSEEQIKRFEELGIKAANAATEVKTFSMLIDTLREAVGSGWAQTWEILFGDFEEAKKLWTEINDVVGGFIDRQSRARNDLLKEWAGDEIKGREKLIQGLSNAFKVLQNIIKPVSDAFGQLFPPLTAKKLGDLTDRFVAFTEKAKKATENFPMNLFNNGETEKGVTELDKVIKKTEKVGETAKETTETVSKSIEAIRQAVRDTIRGDYGNGMPGDRQEALKKAGFDPQAVQDYVNKVRELGNGTWNLSDEIMAAAEASLGLTEKLTKETEASTQSVEQIEEKVSDVVTNTNLLTAVLVSVGQGIKNIFGSTSQAIGAFVGAFSDARSTVTVTRKSVIDFLTSIDDFSKKLKISEKSLKQINSTGKKFFTTLKTLVALVAKFTLENMPAALEIATSILQVIAKIVLGVASLATSIAQAVVTSNLFSMSFDALGFVLRQLAKGFSTINKVIDYFGEKADKAREYMSKYLKEHDTARKLTELVSKAFTKLTTSVTDFGRSLGGRFGIASLEDFKKKIDGLIDSLGSKFLMPGFENFVGLIDKLFNGEFKIPTLSQAFTDISNSIQDFVSKQTIFDGFEQAVKAIVSGFEGLGDLAKQFVDGTIPTFGDFKVAFGDFINSIAKNLDKVDWVGVAAVVGQIGLMVVAFEAIATVAKAVKTAKDLVKTATGTMVAIKGFFGKVNGILDNFTVTKTWTAKFKSVAKSMVILSAAIYIVAQALIQVSRIPKVKLEQAGIAIGAIAGTLLIMEILLSKFGKGIEIGTAASILGFAAAIKLIVTALEDMANLLIKFEGHGEILQDAFWDLVAVMGVMVGVVAALSFIEKKIGGMGSIGGMITLVGFVLALKLLVTVLDDIAALKIPNLDKFFITLVSVVLSLVALSFATRIATFGGGFGVLAIVLALKLLLTTLDEITNIDLNKIMSSLGQFILIGLTLVAIAGILRLAGANALKAGVGILAVAIALRLIANTVKIFGEMDPATAAKGIMAVKSLMVTIGLLMLATAAAGQHAIKAGVAILLISIALNLLVVPVFLLGSMKASTALKGVAALVILMIAVSGLMNSMVFAGEYAIQAGVAILLVAASLSALVYTIYILGNIEASKLYKAVVAIGLLSAFLGGLMVLSKHTGASSFAGILAIAGAVTILSLALVALANVPMENLGAAVASLIVVGVLMEALMTASKYTDKATVAKIIVMGVVIGALAAGMAGLGLLLKDIDGTRMLEQFAAITMVVIALGGVLAILSSLKVGPADAAKAGAAFDVFTAIIGALAVLAGTLNDLTGGGLADTIAKAEPVFTNIGRAIGGLIKGIGTVIFGEQQATPEKIEQVKTFGERIGELVNSLVGAAKKMEGNESSLESLKKLVGIVGEFAKAEFINGISEFLGGGKTDFGVLGTQLGQLADALVTFQEKMQDTNIDPEVVDKALELATGLAKLYGMDELKSGGFLQQILGESIGLDKLGKQLGDLATGLKDYANEINKAKFNDEQIETSKKMLEFFATIYGMDELKSGGFLQKLLGESIRLDTLGTQLKTLATGLKDYADEINKAKFNDEQIEGSKKMLTMLADLQGAPGLRTGGLLGELVGNNMPLSEFGSSLKALGEGVSEYAKSINATVFSDEKREASKTLLEMLADLAAKNIPTTGGLIGAIFGGKDLNGFAKTLPKLGEGLANYVKTLDEAGFTEDQVAKSFRLTSILTSLSKAADALDNGVALSTFGSYLSEFSIFIRDFINDYFEVQNMMDKIDTSVFRAKIVAIVNAYSELVYMLEAMPNGVAIDFSSVIAELTQATTDIGTAGALMVSSLSGSIRTAKSTLSTELSGITTTIETSYQKFSNLSATYGAEMANKLGDSFGSGAGVFTTAVGRAMTDAEKLVGGGDVVDRWKKAGEALATALATGIKNKSDTVKSAGEHVGKQGASGASSTKDSWKSAGENIASGLASGIRNGQSGVISAATSVAINAYNAAKSALDINSPSRLFAKLGGGIDEGYVKGMEDKEHLVTGKAVELVKRMINVSQDALYKLGDLIDSDVIDDPTITPVLDLSEIQNGANRLYSMLPDSERLSLNGNVDLASMTSRSVDLDRRRKADSDNQMMGSLIDAINSLSALIGNTGNTYNVNGVTYDDGSNISSAVRTLVRAAVVEGRA